MNFEQVLVLMVLLIGFMVGGIAGSAHGEDKFRNKAIASCLVDNGTKPHTEAVLFCTDLVDRWGKVPRN